MPWRLCNRNTFPERLGAQSQRPGWELIPEVLPWAASWEGGQWRGLGGEVPCGFPGSALLLGGQGRW